MVLKDYDFLFGRNWADITECKQCKREHNEFVEACAECGSVELAPPNRDQLKYAEDLLRMGFRVTPVTMVGSTPIVGFNPSKLEKALA